MLHSTTLSHPPISAVKLCRAESTTPVSQLQASLSSQACSYDNTGANTDLEGGLAPLIMDSARGCSVLRSEQAPMCAVCVVSPQTVMEKEVVCSALISQPFANTLSVKDDGLPRVVAWMQLPAVKYFNEAYLG